MTRSAKAARKPALQRLLGTVTAFRRSDSGALLAFWAASFGLILGLGALVFDLGRMAATQSEFQSFADQVALAVAGELDGGADACTRAETARVNLINDFQSFATGSQALSASDVTLTFAADLPALDTEAMAGSACFQNAAFVRAVVNPRNIDFPLAAGASALLSGIPTSSVVRAEAVAGYTSYACDITPMFICLPPGWETEMFVGQGVRLRGGGGNFWDAGNYGFLDLAGAAAPGGACWDPVKDEPLKGAALDRCMLGAEGTVTGCFAQRGGLTTDTGQSVGITSGAINARFDIYENSYNGVQNDERFAPAPNVIKGLLPNCGSTETTNTVPLPPDDCFPGCAPWGDGDWSAGRAEYLSTNHDIDLASADPTHPYVAAQTRWELYKAENALGGAERILPAGRDEPGRQQCNMTPSVDGIDRRTFTVAGVDCSSIDLNGKTSGVQAAAFIKVFLLRPIPASNDLDIYAEVVEFETSGDSHVFHDVVQLYR